MSELCPDAKLPAAFEGLLARLLERDAARRPQSARELRSELEALLAPQRSRRLLRRKLSSVLMSTALFVGAALLANAGARDTQLSTQARQGFDRLEMHVMSFAEQVKGRRQALLAARAANSVESAAAPKPAVVTPAPAPVVVAEEVAAAEPEMQPESSEVAASETSAPEPVEAAPARELPEAVSKALDEAKALTEKGRELRALDVLRRAAERHRDSPELLGALSQALQKNRSWGEAVKVARQRVEFDASADARFDLARLERATGHRERAIALLNGLTDDTQQGSAARELLKTLSGASRVALRD
ncbi:MAG: hypothetical protein QM756_38395 [Polyangiaceae bacterium]